MIKLTVKERNFIEQGGALWCIRPSGTNWEVVRLEWEREEILDYRPPSKQRAEAWIFLLADLCGPDERFAIHHTIARPDVRHRNEYPTLV